MIKAKNNIISFCGESVTVSPQEMTLFRFLMDGEAKPINRCISEIWGNNEPDYPDMTLSNLKARLLRKIAPLGLDILTRKGYRLVVILSVGDYERLIKKSRVSERQGD